MVYCAAVGCNSSTDQKKRISFYRLPREKSIKKAWIAKLRRENLPKDVRVCHLHFEEHCFERDLKVSNFIFKNCYQPISQLQKHLLINNKNFFDYRTSYLDCHKGEY